MMGAVVGSIVGGQTVSRSGRYKGLALVGSTLVAVGMIVFARLSAASPGLHVVYGMVIAGLGMGLLQPVYTLAVQNVAPRHQMGAATSSTIFFRSIGSTVGVAAFGSIMLTRYHSLFAQEMPPHVPPAALPYFSNPLMLIQVRPQLETAFSRAPGGLTLLQTLFANVQRSLESGLHLIFVCSALIMLTAVLLHAILRSEPLRTRLPDPVEV
jgi:MFS family permease